MLHEKNNFVFAVKEQDNDYRREIMQYTFPELWENRFAVWLKAHLRAVILPRWEYAVPGTNYDNPSKIEINTSEWIFFDSRKNEIPCVCCWVAQRVGYGQVQTVQRSTGSISRAEIFRAV